MNEIAQFRPAIDLFDTLKTLINGWLTETLSGADQEIQERVQASCESIARQQPAQNQSPDMRQRAS